MPKGSRSARLTNWRLCERGRSLGAGRMYGDPYGGERNHTAVRLGGGLHLFTKLGTSQGS
jgi:hypothetical protein